MNNVLEKQYKYFKDNESEIIEQHPGMYVVIHDYAVAGAFKNELDALEYGRENFELGTFLVQRCSPGADIQTFHTRVSFG